MKDKLNGIEPAYFIELLFEDESNMINTDKINEKICKSISETELIFDSEAFNIFLLKNYVITKNDGSKTLAGISMSKKYLPFNPNDIPDLEYDQYIYQPVSQDTDSLDTLINSCSKKIILGDWMCAYLPYKERCSIIHEFLKIVVSEFADCKFIRIPSSGKLLTREECLNNPWPEEISFINEGINFRLFQITDGENPGFVADTLGLYALGLPDLQIHFHTLSPSDIIGRLEDYASYIFSNGDIINDGEKVDGLYENDFWYCQHEKSIVPPYREVLDLSPGKFAGRR